ncbi:MAG: hypothetical protein IJE10_02530 [Clostridia bacterium]|nr:hypothetical protein [Clostridia bacterium]
MNFKNISDKYRPIPFWSWNEKLDTEETRSQIKKMHDVGIGGFFMHARGGLQTEYMGEEWFENVSVSIDEAEKLGMGAWAYDENGWPSGFGNGFVNGHGIDYQQKYLRFEKEFTHKETAICQIGDLYFYYDVNPFYVDTLDEKIIAKFIECTYEPYYQKYKNSIEGFFTDEPQVSRNGIPWSFVMVSEYQNRYNDDLLSHLDALFFEVDGYKEVRVNFWKMVTDLFSSAYMKQIYDWCDERGLKLTGHLVLEETFLSQLPSNGACMPHYEYFHIPGMDWLGRGISDGLTMHQLSSVAQQLGKKQVLSETFACCGHNISFSELKGMYEWQMVRGVNLLCQHLEGYSNRGIRKRDYPPAMYCQQPWWSEYKHFVDAMSREGMILTEGKIKPEILVIHPQTSAWTLYDAGENAGINEKFARFINLIHELEEKHLPFHLGDETIMERHARVVEDRIEIGFQSYKYVITAECDVLLPTTEKILSEFTTNGGIILDCANSLDENSVTTDKSLTYTLRENDKYKVHYFTNTSVERKRSEILVNGLKVNIEIGELEPFESPYEFEPWGSLMVVETEDTPQMPLKDSEVRLSGTFAIKGKIENSITLDKCDYYFDGELQEKDGYVLNIAERANELARPVKIHQEYFVTANYIPEKLYLVCETPEIFKIYVNGIEVEFKDEGYFRDISFRKTDISKYLILGKNTISFDCNFVQSETVYENIRKSKLFESEKNKLFYDMEIEAIYLAGDFSVGTDDNWEKLDKNAVRYTGDFTIEEPKSEITLSNIEQQGFPFFSGELTVEGTVDVLGENPYLMLDLKGINAVRIKIGNNEKITLYNEKIPILDIAEKGRNKIEITLINNLRNLLGPHHLEIGESYGVGPGSFFKERCVWNYTWKQLEKWNEGYCFVETGVC